jgi:hypothetical protein
VATRAIVLAALVSACSQAPAPLASAPPSASASASAAPDTAPPSTAATTAATPATAPASTPPAVETLPPATPGPLLEVLTRLEPAHDTVVFTDWVALKRSTGADAVTGDSTFEAKVAALGTEYAASDGWLSYLRTHRADWGFDAFDLAWEATGTSPAGALHVLRFADPSRPTALMARLDALGYPTERLANGTLRAGMLQDQVGKVRPSPALTTVALLEDGVTLVASSNADLVRAVAANGPVTPDSDAAVAAAALIVEPTTAFLLAGDPCTAITRAVLTTRHEGDGPSVEQQLATAGTLGHPDVIAVSYGTGATVHGRVVMTYADPAVAKADFEPRGILARAGSGIARPLAEVQTVVDARLEGSSIVLDLEPPAGEDATKGFARRLMAGVNARDMIYAACTP